MKNILYVSMFLVCMSIIGCQKEPQVIKVESVTLSTTSLSMFEGDSQSLIATISPNNADNKTIIWSTSNSSVATVDDKGTVTAITPGSATITAKSDDGGKTATCAVTVNAKVYPVESISLDKTSAEITKGETTTITATIKPDNASNKTVIWSSSNEEVAIVKDGVVTAIKEGEATITAKSDDGGKTATCAIKVNAKYIEVESVSLDKTEASLKVGETITLTATISPADATDKTITWSSSDESITTVKDGVVTAIKVGTATITAKAGDKTATCTFTVKAEATTDPFTITSVGSTTVSITINGSPYNITLEYRIGKEDWSAYKFGSTISLSDGEKVQFIAGEGGNTYFSKESKFYMDDYEFKVSGSGTINVSGNIMSLLDKTGERVTMPEYGFYKLFYGCKNLVDASKLKLPATTLADYCYYGMFHGCSNLQAAPELPATTLADHCYSGMFSYCESLQVAPQLPATTLADYCYSDMFYECRSLQTAPELPATTLADGCYSDMFYECHSLQIAPKLPATTLADYCYYCMFQGCISLQAAPELPATTLADHCYYYMFFFCKSLQVAPQLPATTLADYCYYCMFRNCISLQTAPQLPATTLADHCYSGMFSYCDGLQTAPQLPATTLAVECYNEMFSYCNSLQTAPELPATTLADGCYSYMFYGCTKIKTAPELPATTLVKNCYCQMFHSCYNLNYVKALFTTSPTALYTDSWLGYVNSKGTFVKSKDATWNVTGPNGIPSGWTVQTE